MTSAMRALLALLGQPLFDAVSACKFGAARTQHGILDLAVADEALEYLLDVLVRIVLRLFAHLPNGRRSDHAVASV